MTILVKSAIEEIIVPCYENSKDYMKLRYFGNDKCTIIVNETGEVASIVLSKHDAKALIEELLKWTNN